MALSEMDDLGDLGDWEILLRFLPEDWERLGVESGALRRARGFKGSEQLLRTLLLYLVEGRSLRETAMRVQEAGIASVSSVAIWKRLRISGDWFRLLNEGLMRRWQLESASCALAGRRVRAVDASVVSEPGKTGSQWRIHYMVELPSLRCASVTVTDMKKGETLKRFEVESGDLLLGDRIYAKRQGLRHVLSRGGDVLLRMPYNALPLVDDKGKKFDLLVHLRRLRKAQVGDWPCLVQAESQAHAPMKVRICALAKSRAAAARAREKVLEKAKKNGRYTPSAESIEAAGYFFVLTTMPAQSLSAAQALELYRGRWQVELVFKRLKSILGLGHLPKQEPQGALAWLQGKLFIASLVEVLIRAGESFFPWGYPLQCEEEPVARNGTHV